MDTIPFEILEIIIIDSVVQDVRERRMAKSVWEDLAQKRMAELKTVSSRFRSLIHSNGFQVALKAELRRWNIISLSFHPVREIHVEHPVFWVAKLNDKLYSNRSDGVGGLILDVYECGEVLAFKTSLCSPAINGSGGGIVACHNCLYMMDLHCCVWKIDVESGPDIKPKRWYTAELGGELSVYSVHDVIIRMEKKLYILGEDASVIRAFQFPESYHLQCVIQRPSGNVIICYVDDNFGLIISELDSNWNFVHTNDLREFPDHGYNHYPHMHLDSIGRLLLFGFPNFFFVFDTELNIYARLKLPESQKDYSMRCYDSKINHVIIVIGQCGDVCSFHELCLTDLHDCQYKH